MNDPMIPEEKLRETVREIVKEEVEKALAPFRGYLSKHSEALHCISDQIGNHERSIAEIAETVEFIQLLAFTDQEQKQAK